MLNKAKEDAWFKKFFDTFREIHINLPLLYVLKGISKQTKFIKNVVINKIKL